MKMGTLKTVSDYINEVKVYIQDTKLSIERLRQSAYTPVIREEYALYISHETAFNNIADDFLNYLDRVEKRLIVLEQQFPEGDSDTKGMIMVEVSILYNLFLGGNS